MKLAGKVAVITGGNSGIGPATAREFVANGAKVVIFGRNRATLDQAVADLGEDALAVESDVRRTSDLDRLFVMAKAALISPAAIPSTASGARSWSTATCRNLPITPDPCKGKTDVHAVSLRSR